MKIEEPFATFIQLFKILITAINQTEKRGSLREISPMMELKTFSYRFSLLV